jgi:hypothetical protein
MSNLLFALQVCPIDCDAALDLCKLIAELEQDHPAANPPSWLIVYRRDTPRSRIWTAQSLLSKYFNRVWATEAEHFGSGWPTGSNALWRSTMEDIERLHHAGDINEEGVLTFEPDCCPLQSNWIDLLQREYDERTKPIVGNAHDQEAQGGVARHINGNAMFPVWLAHKWPQLLETPISVAWDYHHREFILNQAQDTNLITSYYRRKVLTDQEWKYVQKNGTRPALLHGVKDATARDLARTHLLRGRNPSAIPSVLGSRALKGPV